MKKRKGFGQLIITFACFACAHMRLYVQYDYDTVYDFMAGQEINLAKFAQPPLLAAAGAPYNYSSIVVLYPSVFVHETQMAHFVAYARGATQNDTVSASN